MVIQISAAVAATAFVVLVVAVVVSLRKLNQTLDSVDTTLNEVRPKVEALADDSRKTLEEARQLINGVNRKTEQTEPLFESIQSMGEGLRELSSSITRTASTQKERLGNVTALVSSGMDLLRKWRLDKPVRKKGKRVK